MSDNKVTLEINGKSVEASVGSMLIEAASEAGIHIPRFCYHPKLSIAANCRMCMVEVERAPKPLPACATPVSDGMKVFTKSRLALEAQRSAMEFLLINHPLDCPICDQGGECELQDVAVGYGGDVSQYTEGKRVVSDPDIGPLVATDLTRCIHCTRCVRFGEEVAGIREMGATGRGEFMKIGTFVEKSIDSEMSGNIIDLCPVGALTAKPSRYHSRAWELTRHAGVAPHDSIGSNLYAHTREGEVVRVVPRDNEAINEAWLADRDRFSYEALSAQDRITSPMVKEKGEWQTVSWEIALETVTERLKAYPPEDIAAWLSSHSTLEELYLAQKYLRSLGVADIEHRLKESDFTDQEALPLFPWLGMGIAEMDSLDSVLLVGSNIRKEQPIAAHRLHQATRKNQAAIHAINPLDFDFNFPVSTNVLVDPLEMVEALAAVAVVVFKEKQVSVPAGLANLIASAHSNDEAEKIAASLLQGERSAIIIGNLVTSHPQAAVLRALASAISEASGIQFGILANSANAAGAWLAGAVPHRGPAGVKAPRLGRSLDDVLENPPVALFLLNTEPEFDSAQPARALAAMEQAEFTVSLSPFMGESVSAHADVVLPISPVYETSGTFVNTEGRWQSFSGATKAQGESRPAWKVLRVLGNLAGMEGFDQLSSEEIRDELKLGFGADLVFSNYIKISDNYDVSEPSESLQLVGGEAIYGCDQLVRRAPSLQATADGRDRCVRISRALAAAIHVESGESVTVSQDDVAVDYPVIVSDAMAANAVYVPMGIAESSRLSRLSGPVVVARSGGKQ